MTSPAPGWYPDPGGTAPYRWWNGQAWTTATSDGAPPVPAQAPAPAMPTAAPAATASGYPAGQAGYGGGAPLGGTAQLGGGGAQFGAGAPSAGAPGAAEPGQMTAYGTPSPFAQTTNYSQVMQTQQAQGNTLWHQNQMAMTTFVAAALSILFAVSTGFVPLIVTPFLTAFASRGKSEKLAPLAFGAAIICGVIGFITLRDRF